MNSNTAVSLFGSRVFPQWSLYVICIYLFILTLFCTSHKVAIGQNSCVVEWWSRIIIGNKLIPKETWSKIATIWSSDTARRRSGWLHTRRWYTNSTTSVISPGCLFSAVRWRRLPVTGSPLLHLSIFYVF